jgi:uncharacterized membrane protein
VVHAAELRWVQMNQPVDRAHRAANRAADPAVQDGAAGQPGQPGMRAQESLPTESLWTLFQADQQRISALDTIAMTIRGWTVTLVSALAGFSLTQHHRSLLFVAMVGVVLFGLLDVHYRRTQLLHGARATKVQDLLAPGYRLGHPGEPQEPGEQPRPGWTRYVSTVLFYVFLLFLLLLLWIVP